MSGVVRARHSSGRDSAIELGSTTAWEVPVVLCYLADADAPAPTPGARALLRGRVAGKSMDVAIARSSAAP